ncbi:MAG: FtsX-like permease family protein [Clostridia bacterium]|nr:FtsX-like permease family protein [Clostridia bacterium]
MKRLFIKVIRDLFKDKFRAVMSLLAITVGMIAFGVMLFSYDIVNREIVNVFSAINPSSATVTVDRVDDKLVSLTREFKGFNDFEEKGFYELRMKTSDNKWKTLHLFAVKDFSKMKINKIRSLSGDFQPHRGEILIERDALGVADAVLNDTISILLPDSRLQEFKVTGVVNDINLHPASIHNTVYAYVAYDTLAELGLQGNRIDFIIAGNKYEKSDILAISNEYMKLLEHNGYKLKGLDISKNPGVSIHMDEYDSVLFILRIFSVVSFIFGCMIMSGLLSTILSNQIRQIGILKAIGARTKNIFPVYMLAILLLVLITVAVSFPSSVLISKTLSVLFMRLGNMPLPDSGIPGYLYVLFCVSGITVPLLVSFFPIKRGIRATVKDALSNYGINGIKASSNLSSPQLGIFKAFSRPVIMSLRNALRRKGRLYMNIATLTLGGAIFVAVVTSMMSLQGTLSKSIKTLGYDYQITTSSYIDDARLAHAVKKIPEIKQYESWGVSGGKHKYKDGKLGNLYTIIAPSHDTKMMKPEIMDGRWFIEGDTNGIIVGHKFFLSEPDYKLGDTITFLIGNSEEQFKIIGTVKELGSPAILLNKKSFDRLIPEKARQNCIKLSIAPGNANKDILYHRIEDSFEKQNINIFQGESKNEQYKILSGHFMIILVSFLIVSLMVVVVASFGLTSTMSVQVSERTKEIGIMKAMGATKLQIRRVVTAESIFICILSWLISILVGIPAGIMGAYVFGYIIIDTPLNIDFTSFIVPFMIWLVLTVTTGYFSSRTAARRASSLSIKDTLAYE